MRFESIPYNFLYLLEAATGGEYEWLTATDLRAARERQRASCVVHPARGDSNASRAFRRCCVGRRRADTAGPLEIPDDIDQYMFIQQVTVI